MGRQMTLAEMNDEFGAARTNKKEFLEKMDRIIPWATIIALVQLMKKERDSEAHSSKKETHGTSDTRHISVQTVKAVWFIMLIRLLHGDSGYIGVQKRPEAIVKNNRGKKIKYLICRKPSTIQKLSRSGQYAAKKAEHKKSSLRCKVKHVFAVVKKLFGYRKTRY